MHGCFTGSRPGMGDDAKTDMEGEKEEVRDADPSS
jgi:hypothetical protein